MHNWQVRGLGAEDLDALCTLEQDCFAAPWSRDQLATYLRQPRFYCVGLYRGQLAPESGPLGAGGEAAPLLGFAIFSWLLDEAELLQVGLAVAHRGQGGARVLLEEAHALLSARQITRVMLEVRCSNAAAIALYKRLGYVEDGRRRGYYPAPHGREDAVLMSWNGF